MVRSGVHGNLLLDFIADLNPDDRRESLLSGGNTEKYLLSTPACSFFIFRMLPVGAQQCVLRMIWNSNVVEKACEPTKIAEWLTTLRALGILDESSGQPRLLTWFSRAYLRGVMEGAHRCSQLEQAEVEDKKCSSRDIAKKSAERWECILRYLALPSEVNMKSVSETTRRLLRAAGFTSGRSDANIEITSAGFQFLLLSPVHQMWTYMIEYLRLEQCDGRDVRPLVSLLIRMVLCVDRSDEDEDRARASAAGEKERDGDDTPRRSFRLDDRWSERENEMVMHMRELGLVFIRKRKDGVFFLTPLLSHLSVGESEGDTAEMVGGRGNVVVETNFRVYAYTSSSLQLAILSTFTEMTYRFHDMSVGQLSRDAVRRALQVGITAAQIISFLRANAHPQSASRQGAINCVPVTVADQIRLWEEERQRLQFQDAALYSTFDSEREFTGVLEFAHSQGILLWSDTNQKLVMVTEEGHELVRQWWKREGRGQGH